MSQSLLSGTQMSGTMTKMAPTHQPTLKLIHLWLLWIPFSVCMAIGWGGLWIWLPLLTLGALHPALDFFARRIGSSQVLGSGLSEFLILAYPAFQTAALIAFLFQIRAESPSSSTLIVRGLYFGLMSGAIGITVAHELIHRSARWRRGIGVWLLSLVLYSHYRVEHIFGHHVRVATREDSSTGRRGEWFYSFWVRAVFEGYRNAWALELRKDWKKNRLVRYVLLQLALLSACYEVAGTSGLIFFVLQALTAILLLELIDYVEHYGLERKRLPGGGYEAFTARHAWDSNHRFTNAFLINLGRHADHHLHPRRLCTQLVNQEGGPLLPYGYSTMLILALIPPLYFRAVEPALTKT